MSEGAELDVLGIGNAIVDVLAHCDDGFLEAEGLVKGSMNLIEVEQSKALYERHGPRRRGVRRRRRQLDGRDRLVRRQGRLHREDPRRPGGEVFAHDIRAVGVHFDTPVATDGPPTALSLILVTPDAHRTMSTYLGAATELGPRTSTPTWWPAAR